MFIRQKGFIPAIYKIISISFLVFTFFNIVNFWVIAKDFVPGVQERLILIIPILLFSLMFGWISMLFMGMYPDLFLSEEGIYYKWFIFRGLIRWNEINQVISLNKWWLTKNTMGLIIIRDGYSFLNRRGLWFFSYYARFLNIDFPIIFISPKGEYRNKIEKHLVVRPP
jgi:hypothetical protein